MNNTIFIGPFASHIKNHVLLKQAIGYKYKTESEHLLRFSVFTAKKYPKATKLSKEIVLDWCSKKTYESQNNQLARASMIRQLCVYIEGLQPGVYMLPKGCYSKKTHYVPYIYTKGELQRFFNETDNCHYVSECPCRHLIMPIFFRMIYFCGLRPSEARLLKTEDVDLKLGILSILHSKNDKSRLIPVSDKLKQLCCKYFEAGHTFFKDNDYFFPGLSGKPMTKGNVYHNFRRFLWKAGISHGGRGKGPRIIDFRHSYACHCLKKWVKQGKDLTAYLPLLKTYMGHNTFTETAYYLRMTADVFPDIVIKLEGFYPDIVPLLKEDIQ